MSTNLRAARDIDDVPDGTGRRIAIVCSRFNDAVVTDLVRSAEQRLRTAGVADDDVETFWVPGALEIPQVACAVAASGRFDAIVALGAVIRGDTYHFELVCDTSAAGLMQLSMVGDVVVTNGILTVDDEQQAAVRSADDDRNKGGEAAAAALQTLAVIDRVHGVR